MDFKRTRHSRPQYTGAGRAAGIPARHAAVRPPPPPPVYWGNSDTYKIDIIQFILSHYEQ